MPYVLRKRNDEWCVFKKGDASPVSGGCHPTRAKALDHMRALYANVPDARASRESVLWVDPPTTDQALRIAASSDMSMERMDEGSPFWMIRNVPIVSTGIEYPLSTGRYTFTPEDLADAVRAQLDPAVVQPRIYLGHDDPRFNGDGEPAIGRVLGMRLTENEQTVHGDLVGLPEWFANIIPIAYPNRSIEGDVKAKTVTGNRYGLIITDLKLLGVQWPGISTLEDLPILFSAKGPKGVKVSIAASSTTEGG